MLQLVRMVVSSIWLLCAAALCHAQDGAAEDFSDFLAKCQSNDFCLAHEIKLLRAEGQKPNALKFLFVTRDDWWQADCLGPNQTDCAPLWTREFYPRGQKKDFEYPFPRGKWLGTQEMSLLFARLLGDVGNRMAVSVRYTQATQVRLESMMVNKLKELDGAILESAILDAVQDEGKRKLFRRIVAPELEQIETLRKELEELKKKVAESKP